MVTHLQGQICPRQKKIIGEVFICDLDRVGFDHVLKWKFFEFCEMRMKFVVICCFGNVSD